MSLSAPWSIQQKMTAMFIYLFLCTIQTRSTSPKLQVLWLPSKNITYKNKINYCFSPFQSQESNALWPNHHSLSLAATHILIPCHSAGWTSGEQLSCLHVCAHSPVAHAQSATQEAATHGRLGGCTAGAPTTAEKQKTAQAVTLPGRWSSTGC